MSKKFVLARAASLCSALTLASLAFLHQSAFAVSAPDSTTSDGLTNPPVLAAPAPSAPPANPAVPKMDNIRVAFYLDSPKFKASAPHITLASPGGLTIGVRSDAGTRTWLDFTGGQAVRGSADQFRVQVAEMSDPAQAKAVSVLLAEGKFATYIYKVSRQGKPVYQVGAGPFATKELAEAARTALKTNPGLAQHSALASLAGPFHWNAGTFVTETEALLKLAALNQAGLPAELAYQENAAGQPVYSVFLGSESDAGRLNALKQQVAQVPGLVLQPVDAASPYIIKREDVTAGDSAASSVPLYVFNPSGQKVWIAPKQGKITVKEKNGDYRGGIELSVFNGKLAVINELPLEHYLYSVVSAEMGTGWPGEALKAQAVAARTYAVQGGVKHEIAHVSDTTLDQAYNGKEYNDVTQAVEATKGEMLAAGGGLISPVFSSNAGGVTSAGPEVWGNPVAYLKSQPSPDEGAAKNKPVWHRVAKADGTIGYVHPSYLKETGSKNAIGLPVLSATEAVKIRSVPLAVNSVSPVVGELAAGEKVAAVGQAAESNAYSWMRGPYTSAQLTDNMGGSISSPLRTLEVSARGVSGRVTALKANGAPVKASYPDSFRTLLNGLPSTLFDIEETGRYTILGADGGSRNYPEAADAPYVLQAGSAAAKAVEQSQMAVLNGSGNVRIVTKDPQFVFTGKGNGHGLGMSQWGARGMAEQGNDYRAILLYYYSGATLVKE